MTVREIIEELQKFNPEMEIKFMGEIESGRSSSFCNDMNVMTIEEDEDGTCVEFRVFGDEDDWS